MFRCISRVALAGATAVLIGVPAAAQTVDEIVAKNLEAKGGVARLRETNTMRITGTATMQGMKSSTVTLSKRPNLMRREIELQGKRIIQGFDGNTFWMAIPDMPPQEMPPGPQTDMLRRNADFDSVFLDWEKKGHKLEFKGKVNEKGREFFHLVLTPKNGPAVNYYLDVETGLEAKTVIEIDDPNAKDSLETRFSDYRNVDGRMIPFSMNQTLNGTPMAQVRWEKVEFNVPLDDALFRMPR